MREHENRSRHDAPETLNLIELKKKDINSLIKIAREYNIENANSMREHTSNRHWRGSR